MRVNGDRLLEVQSALKTVHTNFSDAEKLSEAWGDVVGHRGLADTLDDFSGNWDDTRDNMLEGITAMADAAGAMAETFEDLDNQLAEALTDGS
ncbi:MAG: hypothetical protein ABWX74_15435 [Aeromicrobium sp.]